MRPVVVLLALVALLTLPGSAAAQSGLEEVERLTRLGRTEEARTALMTWWGGERDRASRRELQRGLWLRGRLTVDPVQAELEFQRLVVLYPSGQFTADAILRLAQGAFAMGDGDAARRHVTTLARDYPRSEARRRGEAWLADAGPVPPPPDQPSELGDPPEMDVPADAAVDVSSRTEPPAVEPDRAEPPEQRSAQEPATAPVMRYYVQLGAFADPARAVSLFEEVRADGVEVRVVRVVGSRFTHVRVGRFVRRADAVEVLEELTGRGINAALVRDDRAEEPIGG